MTTVDRVAGLLCRARYRPGWTITAHPVPFGDECWILIDGRVPDSEKWTHDTPEWVNRARGHYTNIGVRAVVPEFTTDTEFFDWLAWRLLRCERHESREFFWVDGKCWDSPHKRPQPKHDYLVRKVDSGERFYWTVQRPDGAILYTADNWDAAYRKAWRQIVFDDLGKTDKLVNG